MFEFTEIRSRDMLNYYETRGRKSIIIEWQQRYSEILLKVVPIYIHIQRE